MTRRAIGFDCGPAQLIGMLDCATLHGSTGVLIVSGGTEIRAGAFAGTAQLAARLADEAGVPVLRFDRRGIGDSEGDNPGWQGSATDIAAALAAFRRALPGMRRVVGYGVCDAASALMLHAATLAPDGLDGLLLVNPWTIGDAGTVPGSDTGNATDAIGHTPTALRRRYLARLTNPRALWRLLSGRVDLRRLWHGLDRARQRRAAPSPLIDRLTAGLDRFGGAATVVIAAGDRVGQRFAADWPTGDARVMVHNSASHTFLNDPAAAQWLFDRLIEATASRH